MAHTQVSDEQVWARKMVSEIQTQSDYRNLNTAYISTHCMCSQSGGKEVEGGGLTLHNRESRSKKKFCLLMLHTADALIDTIIPSTTLRARLSF